ncbi:MAG TPA: oxygenase MpaB family protein [Polyangiaceae bacterium]|nr:oxygenase MpaB family protein [Polyangiaceae bacterium]
MIPTRFRNLDRARQLYGDRADRLAGFLFRCDPPADRAVEAMASLPPGRGWALLKRAIASGVESVPEAPEAFRELFRELERVPAWVDRPTLDRGGRLLLRSGLLGGLVLGTASLVYGYSSPGGNKPLIASGALSHSVGRRLGETSRFVQATCSPGGLDRRGAGFDATVRVRVMHAQVRRLLRASGRWRNDDWGEPINQHDMAATSLLFSLAVIDGLRKLGFRVSQSEVDDYLHLWRYSGHLMGVDPELLPASEGDARRLWGLIELTEGEPDDDSRALTRALLDAPLAQARTPDERRQAERIVALSRTFCRALVGDRLADQLAVPRSQLRHVLPALRLAVGRFERARLASPALDRRAFEAGQRYWARAVAINLGRSPAEFAPPLRLGALSRLGAKGGPRATGLADAPGL